MRAASVRMQVQGGGVCSLARQQGHRFQAKPRRRERQSRYEKPLDKAAQPIDISTNRTQRKSQDKSAAYPEVGMDSVFGGSKFFTTYAGETILNFTG